MNADISMSAVGRGGGDVTLCAAMLEQCAQLVSPSPSDTPQLNNSDFDLTTDLTTFDLESILAM